MALARNCDLGRYRLIDAIALLVAIGALAVAFVSASETLRLTRREIDLVRDSNSLGATIEIFREHRSESQVRARHWIKTDLMKSNPTAEISAKQFLDLPEEEKLMALDVAFLYDDVGALVAHDLIDIDAISGYLGT